MFGLRLTTAEIEELVRDDPKLREHVARSTAWGLTWWAQWRPKERTPIAIGFVAQEVKAS